jgi:hypothetical protein
MANVLPSSIVAGISFLGRTSGAVKALAGFKKGHHTLPDAANAVTNGFLGKICAAELASQAEAKFQRVREALGYKRKDFSLNVASPAAVLTTKDFVWELSYALEPESPARYLVSHTLHSLRSAELARTDEFTSVFAGDFTEISFLLKKGVSVEAIVDVIEALNGEGGLSVTYPSDCRECVIAVEDVDAQVRCNAAAIEMVFPKAGAPRDLIATFAEVRGAFGISRVLAGLIA